MANEQEGTQALPEGEAALNPGTTAAPEQNDDQQHNDANNGDAGEEGKGAAEGKEGEGTGADEGTGESQQEEPKPKKKLPWELRRINEETNKRRAAEVRAEELAAEVERLKKGGQVEPAAADSGPDLDTLANQRAEQLVEQREYQARVAQWGDAGVKDFGADEFNASCNLIASLMDDRQQAAFMRAVTDPEIVEDGHKVVVALAADPEEAERILALPPVKQALALAKLSAKLGKPTTPTPKPISKVPPPVKPIGGNTQVSTSLDDPNVPMDKFADEFLKNMALRKR